MRRQPQILHLALRRSRLLGIWLLASQALALTGLLLFPPAPVVTAALLFTWAVIGVHGWWCHVAIANPARVVALSLDGNGGWWLKRADGRVIEPLLLADSRALPALLLLNFRLGRWRRRSLLLLPDSADADALRRLRVRLRVGEGYAGASGSSAESGS